MAQWASHSYGTQNIPAMAQMMFKKKQQEKDDKMNLEILKEDRKTKAFDQGYKLLDLANKYSDTSPEASKQLYNQAQKRLTASGYTIDLSGMADIAETKKQIQAQSISALGNASKSMLTEPTDQNINAMTNWLIKAKRSGVDKEVTKMYEGQIAEARKRQGEKRAEQRKMATEQRTGGQQKAGQNWILPDRTRVISYDGGRTYNINGQSRPMPSTAIKVPGGATLSELNLSQVQKQAQAELSATGLPKRQSPTEAALEGTGPYKRLASAFEALAGGLGADVLVGKKGFFPETADAKQYLRSVKQMGKAALMNSARGAIWEQERIDKLFPDPDKLFTNPRIEARKFKNLLSILQTEKRFNNQSIVNALPKEVAKYRTSNNEIDRLITLISEPSSAGVTRDDEVLINKYLKR